MEYGWAEQRGDVVSSVERRDLRPGLSPARHRRGHIERIAALVDEKMRAVAAHGSTVDSLRVAVLAALNIADELLALRERYDALAGSVGRSEDSMRTRADTLAGMLDEVLEDRRAG